MTDWLLRLQFALRLSICFYVAPLRSSAQTVVAGPCCVTRLVVSGNNSLYLQYNINFQMCCLLFADFLFLLVHIYYSFFVWLVMSYAYKLEFNKKKKTTWNSFSNLCRKTNRSCFTTSFCLFHSIDLTCFVFNLFRLLFLFGLLFSCSHSLPLSQRWQVKLSFFNVSDFFRRLDLLF